MGFKPCLVFGQIRRKWGFRGMEGCARETLTSQFRTSGLQGDAAHPPSLSITSPLRSGFSIHRFDSILDSTDACSAH
jgi:hypothetical protein